LFLSIAFCNINIAESVIELGLVVDDDDDDDDADVDVLFFSNLPPS